MSRIGRGLRHPLVRSTLTALVAMTIYGGWALWANAAHGTVLAWRAAGTQGFVSATVTFGISLVMEGLARVPHGRWARFGASAAGGMAVAGSYTIGLHWLMGTPEIVATIAPIFVVGSPYCSVYAWLITRPVGPNIPQKT